MGAEAVLPAQHVHHTPNLSFEVEELTGKSFVYLGQNQSGCAPSFSLSPYFVVLAVDPGLDCSPEETEGGRDDRVLAHWPSTRTLPGKRVRPLISWDV